MEVMDDSVSIWKNLEVSQRVRWFLELSGGFWKNLEASVLILMTGL